MNDSVATLHHQLQIDQSFELPISKDYVRHWGIQEAVRELLQNAIDSESEFTFEIAGNKLIISNDDAELTPSDLILGKSSKHNDDNAIGQFGEGFKLALSVLARENREIVVYNGAVTWIPTYRHNDVFNGDILCIDQFRMETQADAKGLHFVIRNLSDEELQTITHNCLFMREIGETLATTKGQILLDEPGKLFINGLYVTDTKLKYGYNIKPKYLRLERDRQTISDFDLQWETSSMWRELDDQADRVAEDVINSVADVSYLTSSTPVSDACAIRYKESFGDATPVTTQEEANKITEHGGNAAVVPDLYRRHVMSSRFKPKITTTSAPTPQYQLQLFMQYNKKYMRRPAIVAMKELIEKSSKWIA